MHTISRQFRHLMWYVFTGSSGGYDRIKIVQLLMNRPYGLKTLADRLVMDQKTIVRHVNILMDNKFVELGDSKRSDNMIFLTEMFESEIDTFREILERLGIDPEMKEIDWKDFDDSTSRSIIWSDNV